MMTVDLAIDVLLRSNQPPGSIEEAANFLRGLPAARPIPMLLWCPGCGARHVDVGEFATKEHHSHACQSCGHVWRPAIVATVGVQFLPGFKNDGVGF